MNIIQRRTYTYIASALLLGVSVTALLSWGLKTGIDFKGGTLMEVQFNPPESVANDVLDSASQEGGDLTFVDPAELDSIGAITTLEGGEEEAEAENIEIVPTSVTRDDIFQKLTALSVNSLSVQASDENRFIIRYIESDEDLNERVLTALQEIDESVVQLRVDFIGASISGQLKDSAVKALILAIIGITLYIAWAFRKVNVPVPSWQYGFSAIAALVHDIVLVLGVFAFLGMQFGVEVGIPFIAALLTILGYSVNDTIVIYDRIRENLLKRKKGEDFESIVNKSINESLARSINTSLTVVLVLGAVALLAGTSIKFFAIGLIIGVIVGTYSSIFVASALLVTSYKMQKKVIQKNEE